MADVDPAPAEPQDKPTDAPEAPETDKPTGGEEESFVPDSFNLDEVPEAARPHVEALQREWQGSYTKRRQADRQELDEVRRESEEARRIVDALLDDETAPAMLAAIGWEIDEGEGPQVGAEPEYVDPDERIDALESHLSRREQIEFQARQEAEQDELIAEDIEALEGKENRQFDPEEVALLTNQVHATGQPVEAVYAGYKGLLDKRHEEWKQARKAPRRVSPGTPGSRQVDLSKETREERLERMRHAAEEARSSLAD